MVKENRSELSVIESLDVQVATSVLSVGSFLPYFIFTMFSCLSFHVSDGHSFLPCAERQVRLLLLGRFCDLLVLFLVLSQVTKVLSIDVTK